MRNTVIAILLIGLSLVAAQICDPPCENGGVCKPGNVCQCLKNGWSGTLCNVPDCSNFPQQCRAGTCVAPGQCNCTGTGYEGDDCSIPVCDPPCANNGTCTGPNTCKCSGTGYEGKLCTEPVCNAPIGCGPGTCTAPEVCQCDKGWTGKYCTTPICDNPCQHNGTCYGPNACECKGTGYDGPLCQNAVCEPPCENGGTCISPNVCDCSKLVGWTGDRCQDGICKVPCKNGGRCSAPDQCNCEGTGYAGEYCDVEEDECSLKPFPCFPGLTCTNTVGNFTCSACPSGYTGDGKIKHGGCIDIDECAEGKCHFAVACNNYNGSFECGSCPTGYTGSGYMDQGGCKAQCSQTCQHGGSCYKPNECQCTEGWTGSDCSEDIDECSRNSTICDPLTSCVNSNGGWYCTPCPEGYSGSGETQCVQGSFAATTAFDPNPKGNENDTSIGSVVRASVVAIVFVVLFAVVF